MRACRVAETHRLGPSMAGRAASSCVFSLWPRGASAHTPRGASILVLDQYSTRIPVHAATWHSLTKGLSRSRSHRVFAEVLLPPRVLLKHPTATEWRRSGLRVQWPTIHASGKQPVYLSGPNAISVYANPCPRLRHQWLLLLRVTRRRVRTLRRLLELRMRSMASSSLSADRPACPSMRAMCW